MISAPEQPGRDKPALRARMRALRRRLAAEHPDAGLKAAALAPLDRLPAFDTFGFYYPQGSEIDPIPLAGRLAETGAAPALPVAEHREAPLEFRLWNPAEGLVEDAFGVPSPPLSAAACAPQLVIAPLLAFDRSGGRLGQGGGHYDRTLENLRAAGPVFVLGLAYAGQEVDEIPMEPHDQRLDAILTDAGFIPVRQD